MMEAQGTGPGAWRVHVQRIGSGFRSEPFGNGRWGEGPGTQAPKEILVPLPTIERHQTEDAWSGALQVAAREGQAATVTMAHRGLVRTGGMNALRPLGGRIQELIPPYRAEPGTRWLRSNGPGPGVPDPEI